MRILVFGAGVIGSVYAGKLLQAGHEVVMLARGRRLSDLQAHGLVLEEAESGNRTVLVVRSVGEPAPDDRYEVVLVPVRSEQLASTLPVLTAMNDGSDVLFFGNTAGTRPSSSRPSASVYCSASPRPVVFGTARSSGTC